MLCKKDGGCIFDLRNVTGGGQAMKTIDGRQAGTSWCLLKRQDHWVCCKSQVAAAAAAARCCNKGRILLEEAMRERKKRCTGGIRQQEGE